MALSFMPADYRHEPPEVFLPLPPDVYARFHALEMADYEQDVAFYRHFLADREMILEAGCGCGRLSRRLAALGHRVVGIDNSLAMLRQTAVWPGFTAAAMDMRRLAFTKSSFSVAIIAHNTLNLLADEADVRRTLAACHAVLKADGRLLLHLFLPERPAPVVRHMQFTAMPLPPGGQLLKEIVRHYEPDGETMLLTERYKYRPNAGRAAFRNYQQRMTLLAWPPERWRRLFNETGWHIRFFSADAPERFPFAADRALLAALTL
jgi:SAM-dependent methyltransferase